MSKSTTSQTPAKPRPDAPPFLHKTGRWAKKVRGKFVYLGYQRDNPDGSKALELWNEQKADLIAGRTPRVKAEGLTIRELLDRFTVSKKEKLDAREITPKHFAELYACCRRIGDAFGLDRLVIDLAADDFARLRKAVAKVWGPVRLGNEVQRVRQVFKFGLDNGLLKQPVLFGSEFKKPTRKVMRLNRAKNGKRLFTAAELQTIIAAASQPMKAMILLGVNCGFGPSDVANLPTRALDLTGGWVDFPRPKTGIERRIPLWPETIAAIKEAIASRPKPKNASAAGLLFITKQGHKWAKEGVSEPDPQTGKITVTNNVPVVQECIKLLKKLKLHRRGLGFYTLRHTFETEAGGSRDQVATNAIMGHVDESMAANYRERIDDERCLLSLTRLHGSRVERSPRQKRIPAGICRSVQRR